MGMSSGENIKVIEEISGCTRGGARFRQEKRNKTEEGIATIEMQNCEGQLQGMK